MEHWEQDDRIASLAPIPRQRSCGKGKDVSCNPRDNDIDAAMPTASLMSVMSVDHRLSRGSDGPNT